MRALAVPMVVGLAGCNSLLGIHGLSDDAPQTGSNSDAPPGDGRQADGNGRDAPGGSTITLVQQAVGFNNSATSLSVTLTSTPKTGDVLVMLGAAADDSLISVSGGASSWTKVVGAAMDPGQEVWVAVSNGSSTITITSSDQALRMSVTEWSGLATSNIVDQSTSSYGTSATVATSGVTTSDPVDLLLFALGTYPPESFSMTDAGWQAVSTINTGAVVQAAWYLAVDAAGHYSPSATMSPSNTWATALVALRGM